VPARLFVVRDGEPFDFVELALARYPFDALVVELPHDLRMATEDGTLRATRARFALDGDIHEVVIEWMAHGRLIEIGFRIRLAADGHIVEQWCGGPGSDPDDVDGMIASAATWWMCFVRLCHALDELGTSRRLVNVVTHDGEGREYPTRQQARAALRDGTAISEIVLRPGSTLRSVLSAVREQRRAIVRAHPRRHPVIGHERRYHTREGLVTRTLAPFERGGRASDDARVYDATRIGANV